MDAREYGETKRELNLARQVIGSPQRQFVHRGEKRASGNRESVRDRHGWTDLDLAQHQTARLKVAEPLGQDRVTDPLDASSKFRESQRTGNQRAENNAAPPLAEELKGARQRLVARRRRRSTVCDRQIRRDRLKIGGSWHLDNRSIH